MLELADIFREAGPTYREAHAGRMLPSHVQAMDDIVRCRTAALLTLDYLAQRAARSNRAAFDAVLARVQSRTPLPGDELPEEVREYPPALRGPWEASAGAKG